MAKRKPNTAEKEGKAGSDYIAPDDFAFKTASYDDIKREMVKDNPTASIAIAFAEEAGLGEGAKNTIADISKTLMGEAKDFAIRDAAFWGVEHLNNFADKTLGTSEKEQQAKLAIKLVTNTAVVAAKPTMIAWEVFQEKQAKIADFKEEITEFTEAYGKQKDNKIIETVFDRIDKESHSRDTELITSAALGTAQAVARKVHTDQIADKINAKLATELGSIPSENGDARGKLEEEAQKILAKPRLQTVDLLANNQLGEKGSKFSERAFENQQLNMTTGVMAAGAFGASQIEKIATEEQPSKSPIIAADLILYLNEQVKAGEVGDGNVELHGLKGKLPDKMIKEYPEGMPLEQFVELVFNTHVHDQTGETIPQRFHPKIKEISSEIADALLHPSTDLASEATLHPLALIDLVGSGRIVAHDGMHVASLAEAQQEITNATNIMPILPQIQTVEYLEALGGNRKTFPSDTADEMKDLLNTLVSNYKSDPLVVDSIIVGLPQQLLEELGASSDAIQHSRARIKEHPEVAVDNWKEIISEIAAKNDAVLGEQEGLTQSQRKVIHQAAEHVKAGDDDALLEMLNDRSKDSLAVAVLAGKETRERLATGDPLIGYDAQQAKIQAEKEKEAIGTEALQKHAKNAAAREGEHPETTDKGNNEPYNPAKENALIQSIVQGKEKAAFAIDTLLGKKQEELESGTSRADKIVAKKAEPKEHSLAG